MRRLGPRPIEPAVDDLRAHLRPATTLARVQEVWPKVVGPALSGEARPVSERRGTVTIACGSAVWAQELALMSSELVGRLNDALVGPGEASPVESLRFVAGGHGGWL